MVSPTSPGSHSMQSPSGPRTGISRSTSKRTTRVGSIDSAYIRHPADRADGAVIIQHRDIAFGGAVKFHNARDGEAGLEFPPDFRPQAIAGDGAE